MNLNKDQRAIVILFIFYVVGIIGIGLESSRSLFALLTPFNLLLTFGLILWVNGDYGREFWLAFAFIFLIGYTVEVAGIHTGKLFGEYAYGPALGWQVLSVPVIIGINWFILAFASRGTAMLITPNAWTQVLIASFLMVILDFVMEPVAINLDFWAWDAREIPWQNYLMWFGTALTMQYILTVWNAGIHRTFGLVVLAVQFFFFGILNLIL